LLKKVCILLSAAFLLFGVSIFGFIQVKTKTDLGDLHPIFAVVKMLSSSTVEASFIEALESQDTNALSEYRETVAGFYQLSGNVEFNGQLETTTYPTKLSQQALRVYSPADVQEKPPVIIYYHGGGFSSGDIQLVEKLAKQLSQTAHAIVLTPAYRLAPEHPYPAALDDAYAALQWAVSESVLRAWDTERIFVAGDSAGGNLAASVSLLNRDRHNLKIAGQILIYPDLSPLNHPFDEQILAQAVPPSAAFIVAAGRAYVADDNSLPAYHSPLAFDDLRGMPKAFVITAQFDPLRTEGELYYHKLKAANVEAKLSFKRQLGHGFISMLGLLKATDDTIVEIAEFVKN